MADATQVAQVRAFNRFYTNVIGVLHGPYLDSPFTLTEGRLLFEITRHGTVEVSDLRRALDIDAGYLSRVLTRFEAESLITRHRSAADARRQEICVTDAGRAAAADLDRRSADQITELLHGTDADRLLSAMRVITAELEEQTAAGREIGTEATGAEAPTRVVTLRPPTAGDLGWVLHRHATVYAAEFGWDATFEDLCARIIAEYTTLRDAHPDRTAGWIAEVDGVPAGSVFCVPDSDATARLRLLLVEPSARGLGLGARLVGQCLQFAREVGYADITLWTYDRLAAARTVYKAAGFTLTSEHPDDAFGDHMMSQTWSRPL
ncbi:MAG TPA: helix-turn-helix domain-containing GNAT family N-acetyltransferase [Trebonia sp.]|jgi:DNA-binding MarR family transcriptional regulator/GNAT superfamily N-acetyltransferase|nr:helix-turn-helix domain-containing GNAT family N-acetyltransferase [Trebonia sp.]